MLNIKNNFLWKMLEISKFQNPIEKFDKEFWEKSKQAIKRKKTDRRESKILQTKERIFRSKSGLFF